MTNPDKLSVPVAADDGLYQGGRFTEDTVKMLLDQATTAVWGDLEAALGPENGRNGILSEDARRLRAFRGEIIKGFAQHLRQDTGGKLVAHLGNVERDIGQDTSPDNRNTTRIGATQQQSFNDGPWSQTASGRAFPLLTPSADHIDLIRDVGPQLARQTRFNGATLAPYSIAQHCAHGADAIYQETRRPEVAAYFLLHDAHEAVLGDITTPVLHAMAELGRSMGVGAAHCDIRDVVSLLKAKVDHAIFRAAGLPHPGAEIRAMIKAMDLRMLVTERRDLMRSPPHSWGDEIERAEPVRGPRIKPLPWPKALDLWLNRLSRYCPTAFNRPF